MNIETCTLSGKYRRNGGKLCTWMIYYDGYRGDFVALTHDDEESECNLGKDRYGQHRFPTREEAIRYLQGVLHGVDPAY